jgi:hypothetical protein
MHTDRSFDSCGSQVIWNPFAQLVATLDERDPCGSDRRFEVGLLDKIADSGCLAFVSDMPATYLGFLYVQINSNSKCV